VTTAIIRRIRLIEEIAAVFFPRRSLIDYFLVEEKLNVEL
jgi:hypothetical protein